MINIINHLLIMFLFYFSNIMIECEYFPNQEIRNFKDSNFTIDSCTFYRNHIFNGKGGIVFCKDIISNMNLNECIFSFCSCNDFGGAIYFECPLEGTNVELTKICANNCWAEFGMFGYIIAHFKSKNSYNLISLLNCYNKSKGVGSLGIGFGIIKLNNLNSSKNFDEIGSGIVCGNAYRLMSSFCNIAENMAHKGGIIVMAGNTSNFFLNYNIINNTALGEFGIILLKDGIFSFQNIIFEKNKGFLLVSFGELHLIDSYIVHENITFISNSITFYDLNYTILNETFQGQISTQNIINQRTKSFEISVYNTHLCDFSNNENKNQNKWKSPLIIISGFIFFIILSIIVYIKFKSSKLENSTAFMKM